MSLGPFKLLGGSSRTCKWFSRRQRVNAQPLFHSFVVFSGMDRLELQNWGVLGPEFSITFKSLHTTRATEGEQSDETRSDITEAEA